MNCLIKFFVEKLFRWKKKLSTFNQNNEKNFSDMKPEKFKLAKKRKKII